MAKSIVGGNAPLSVIRPRFTSKDFDKRFEEEIGDDDRNMVAAEFVSKFPVYMGVFWAKAQLHIKEDGTVYPDLRTLTIHEGGDGVEPDALDPRQLDYSTRLLKEQARGWLRVDHLEDENGVPMGIPDPVTRAGKAYPEWCKRLLNEARLIQLSRELEHSEGRELNPDFDPAIPDSVRRALAGVKGKDDKEIKRDKAVLANATGQIEEIKASVANARKKHRIQSGKESAPADKKPGRPRKEIDPGNDPSGGMNADES